MFVRRHTVVCLEPSSSFPCRSVLLQDTIHGRAVVSDRKRLERAKRFILDGLASGALKPIRQDVSLRPHRRRASPSESNQQFGKLVVTL
jgi:hypothetical protein